MALIVPDEMQEFTSTQLANNTGDVLAAAAQAPVRIGRHGRARFVVLTVESFERLVHGQNARRARHVSELSNTEAEAMTESLRAPVDRPRTEEGRRERLLAHARAAQARLADDPAEARRLAEVMEVVAENPVDG
jgi:antitoxin Phd